METNLLTLTDLANKHNTDKGTTYNGDHVHGYTRIYEDYLSKWRHSPIRLLEIGVCLEVSKTGGGESVYMWQEYFDKAMIYTFDIVDMSKLNTDRVSFFQGDQSKREDFKSMYSAFGEQPFEFILEDGSHEHEHQMISLAATFPYVASGGLYILEDMSIPGHQVCCTRNDRTYEIIEQFKNTGKLVSDCLTKEEIEYLETHVDTIEVYPDIRDAYAVAIIKKK